MHPAGGEPLKLQGYQRGADFKDLLGSSGGGFALKPEITSFRKRDSWTELRKEASRRGTKEGRDVGVNESAIPQILLSSFIPLCVFILSLLFSAISLPSHTCKSCQHSTRISFTQQHLFPWPIIDAVQTCWMKQREIFHCLPPFSF